VLEKRPNVQNINGNTNYVKLIAKSRPHRGSNTGPHDLQSYALPLSYGVLRYDVKFNPPSIYAKPLSRRVLYVVGM
jgi:hypothetical protein